MKRTSFFLAMPWFLVSWLACSVFAQVSKNTDAETAYQRGVAFDNGDGVVKNPAEAVKQYRWAAERGHANAQNYLGQHYILGDGVAKDAAEAVKWFRKSAQAGNKKAQFNLAVCLDKGDGTAKDGAEAVRWYEKAAGAGEASAQLNLGLKYWRGEGVPKDQAKATTLYLAAAEQEHPKAQLVVARMYASGQGLEQNTALAKKHYAAAAAQGVEQAKTELAKLEASSTDNPRIVATDATPPTGASADRSESLLGGKTRETKRAKPSTSVDDAGGMTQKKPAVVAGSVKRSPSAFAVEVPRDRKASAGAAPPAGKILRQVPLRPDAKPQTVTCSDRVRVTVPAGALDRPADLVVAEVTQLPPGAWADTRPLAGLDLRLGDQHVFGEPIEVEVSYDPAALPPGRDPQECIVAACWRPDLDRWVALPVQVDAKACRARAFTPHLSTVGFWTRAFQALRFDSIRTERFILWYDRAAIQATANQNDTAWDNACQADVADPLEYRRQNVHAQGVPHLIEYVGQALEYAHQRYQGSRLPLPRWTRTDVFVGVGTIYEDPNRTVISAVINLPLPSIPTPRAVRTVVAHEYFHEVEANLLGWAVMSMNYRRWWLDALAEYAQRFVWGEAADMAPMEADFLRLPLHTQNDLHEYAAGHFVRFLVEFAEPPGRTSFPDLARNTLTFPRGLLAVEEMSAVNFSIATLRSALEEWAGTAEPGQVMEAYADYSYAVTIQALERYFAARNADFRGLYLEFAARMLFDGRAPELVPDPAGLEPLVTAQWGQPETLGTDRNSLAMDFTMPAGYSTQVRAVRVQVEGDAQGERTCQLAASDMPPGGAVVAYRLPGFVRPPAFALGASPIILDTTAEQNRREITCEPGDVLFVLGLGRRARDSVFTARLEGATRGLRTVRMRDEAMWTADITGFFVGDELVEKHGVSTTYYDNDGKKIAKRITYVRGVEQGPCTYYHRNGNVSEQGQMANGKRQGQFTRWDEDGAKDVERSYSGGAIDHEVSFRNGRKAVETFYQGGRKTRVVTFSSTTGEVLGEEKY